MVISSFTTPDVSYHTTATTCTCRAREFHPDCKHSKRVRLIEAGRPTTVDEARRMRIARQREQAERDNRNAYSRYQLGYYSE